jgi:predicted acylesterase/phospholipase RssA
LSQSPPQTAGTVATAAPGPQRSLILAGGGMRVAYQAGVLRALSEAGLSFSHADGTSGGTINLAMLLSGLSPVEMCDRWRTLRVKDFVSFMPVQDYLKAWNLPAFGDAKGIREGVFPHLGIKVEKIRAATTMLGTFNVCNYTRKTSEVIPHQQIDLDLLVAGISLPIYMPPVAKDGSLYLDSVWIKDANLMEAVRRGSEELWVVWCIGNINQYKNGIFNQYVHMIELSANGHLFEEFQLINEINARIRQGETVYGHTRPICLHLIKPAYALPLDPDFYLGRIDAATLIDMGYSDAKQYLRQMTPDGLPFEPEVTKMLDEGVGISFRLPMAGTVALGEADAVKGAAAGTEFSLRAAVSIHDLQSFMRDPEHAAVVHGDLSFGPYGENVPAKDGVFKLIPSGVSSKTKLIICELGFEHGGTEFYLAGKGEMKGDALSDLVKDACVLEVQLHQGSGKDGPVAGAGILRMRFSELIHAVSSVHVTNAGSAEEEARALFDFGRFFLGAVWDRYRQRAAVEQKEMLPP